MASIDMITETIPATGIEFSGKPLNDEDKQLLMRTLKGDYLFNMVSSAIDKEEGEGSYNKKYQVFKTDSIIIKGVDILDWLKVNEKELPAGGVLVLRTDELVMLGSMRYLYIADDEDVPEKFHYTVLLCLDQYFCDEVSDKYETLVAFLFHEYSHYLLNWSRYNFSDGTEEENLYKVETYTNGLALRLLRKFNKENPGTIDFEKCRQILKYANETYQPKKEDLNS